MRRRAASSDDGDQVAATTISMATAAAASPTDSVGTETGTAATTLDKGPAAIHSPAMTEAGRKAAGCEGERRPYHTILTSSSGGYQTWQCRVMYHHWQLQKKADPCGEMGGFTRLLTTRSGQNEGACKATIPTLHVKELSGGMGIGGYVVVNRPWSMLQFVQHPDFRKVVREEYVYIAETDHVMLRPLPNLATPTTPAAFNFGYMVAWGRRRLSTSSCQASEARPIRWVPLRSLSMSTSSRRWCSHGSTSRSRSAPIVRRCRRLVGCVKCGLVHRRRLTEHQTSCPRIVPIRGWLHW